MSTNLAVAKEFIAQAKSHLQEEFLPRIQECVNSLSDEQIWWRPNLTSNSVGNMLLHLCGNVRQWIISGLGKAEDCRIRHEEFEERGPIPREDLLEKLESTVREALVVLEQFDPETLLEVRRIQVYDTTSLQAVFNVVEHFSGHTGQIIYVTKMLKDKDMRFYDL